MAIAFSSSASNNTVANPSTVNPGATAGDTIIAAVQSNSTGSTVDSLASGFTQLGSSANTADAAFSVVARKTTATGSEGTIAPIDLSTTEIVALLNFSGVDQTTPENLTTIVVNQNTAANPIVVSSGSFTPTVDGCMIVAIYAVDAQSANNTTTTFSTTSGTTAAWTTPIDIVGATSNRFQIAMGYALQTTAGAITVQASASGDTAGATLYIVVLQPAAGGGGGIVANVFSGRGGAAAQPLV